jgi:hypothetical protein
MITYTRVKQAVTEFVKVIRYGKDDIQTSDQAMPFGIDSKPVKDKIAVHSTTQNKDATVILGYLLQSEKTSEGETRIFATDQDGVEVFDIYLKNDGTCEFGGSGDFFVRYLALNTGLQAFITELNAQLTAGFATVPYTWPGVSLDISNSKIDKIKTDTS